MTDQPTQDQPASADKPYFWRWQVVVPILALIVTAAVGAGALAYSALQSYGILHRPGPALDLSLTAFPFQFPDSPKFALIFDDWISDVGRVSILDNVGEKEITQIPLSEMKKYLVITITNGRAASLPAKDVNVIVPSDSFIYTIEHNGEFGDVKDHKGNLLPLVEDIAVEQTYKIHAWCRSRPEPIERVAVQWNDGKIEAFSPKEPKSTFWWIAEYVGPAFSITLLLVVLELLRRRHETRMSEYTRRVIQLEGELGAARQLVRDIQIPASGS